MSKKDSSWNRPESCLFASFQISFKVLVEQAWKSVPGSGFQTAPQKIWIFSVVSQRLLWSEFCHMLYTIPSSCSLKVFLNIGRLQGVLARKDLTPHWIFRSWTLPCILECQPMVFPLVPLKHTHWGKPLGGEHPPDLWDYFLQGDRSE